MADAVQLAGFTDHGVLFSTAIQLKFFVLPTVAGMAI
jgi:hypothetical protein